MKKPRMNANMSEGGGAKSDAKRDRFVRDRERDD